ncbi:MAG TPA: c-type cytochrome [Burkholderiales bacterium]|nr:c-type cytochrome [Burkholderiales bacterium]
MNYRWPVMLLAGTLFTPAAMAQGPAKADLPRAQQIVTQVCAACHAADGNSTLAVNPVLAGQHAEYTQKQLLNFKSQGGKPAERPNAVMGGMVANLSTDDMRNLAAYFENQKPKPRAARDRELVKLGQTIYRGGILSKNVAACTACHGPNGMGVPAQYPRIAGQFSEYVAVQLKAFRSGERANDPNRAMRLVAEKLSDKEIEAVSEYISGLR